jgi:hypothetical protein
MSTNESTKESTNDLIIESTNKSKNEINKKYYENKKNDFEFIKKKMRGHYNIIEIVKIMKNIKNIGGNNLKNIMNSINRKY